MQFMYCIDNNRPNVLLYSNAYTYIAPLLYETLKQLQLSLVIRKYTFAPGTYPATV